ncbi:hypothetical protein C2W62_18275, partial [Candidatus Entotheonella serta]
MLGPSVNVIPGHRYTCGIYFQGDSIPTTLRLGLKVFGNTARNAGGAKNWEYSASGLWQVATFIFEALAGDRSVRLLISRSNAPNRFVRVRIDDAFCNHGHCRPRTGTGPDSRPYPGTLNTSD